MDEHAGIQSPDSPGADAQCADCVSRRQFLARSAMAAAAAAIAAGCGNGQFGPTVYTPPSNSGTNGAPNQYKVGNYPGLASTGVLVKIDSYQAVKRTGATTFAAYSMVCTHQGCLTEIQNNTFFCPCHGSQFNASGQVTRGPASLPLGQYSTSYDPTTDTLTIG